MTNLILITIFASIILIVSTIGNLLATIVCSRNGLRVIPTFTYMAFMGVQNIFLVFFLNFNTYLYVSNMGKYESYFENFFCNSMSSIQAILVRISTLLWVSIDKYAWVLVDALCN